MSLARVCDRCGHIIKDAKDIERVILIDFNDDFTTRNSTGLPYADVCVKCCRDIFGCFISDERWNNKLYPNTNKEK